MFSSYVPPLVSPKNATLPSGDNETAVDPAPCLPGEGRRKRKRKGASRRKRRRRGEQKKEEKGEEGQ
jgi:hypothetical protein